MFDTSGQKDFFFSVLYKLVCLHFFKMLLFWIRIYFYDPVALCCQSRCFFMLLSLSVEYSIIPTPNQTTVLQKT